MYVFHFSHQLDIGTAIVWIKQLIDYATPQRLSRHRSVDLDDLNLQRTFKSVVAVFFPESTTRFRVKLVQQRNWTFRCSRRSRRISVNAARFVERDDLRAGLVQQLCYATTSGRPAEDWNRAMQKCVTVAHTIGRPRLAERIEKIRQAAWIDELEVYYDPERNTVTTYDGHGLLEVNDDTPTSISFEDSLRFSVLEREIRREEAELKARQSRRKASESAA